MHARIFSTLFALLPVLALANAPMGAPEGLSFRTERAIVFKDGHVLLVKSAEGRTDDEGRLFTDEVPDFAAEDVTPRT